MAEKVSLNSTDTIVWSVLSQPLLLSLPEAKYKLERVYPDVIAEFTRGEGSCQI